MLYRDGDGLTAVRTESCVDDASGEPCHTPRRGRGGAAASTPGPGPAPPTTHSRHAATHSVFSPTQKSSWVGWEPSDTCTSPRSRLATPRLLWRMPTPHSPQQGHACRPAHPGRGSQRQTRRRRTRRARYARRHPARGTWRRASLKNVGVPFRPPGVITHPPDIYSTALGPVAPQRRGFAATVHVPRAEMPPGRPPAPRPRPGPPRARV